MEAASAPEPSALRSYVTVLRRRLGTILLVTIVVTATAVAISVTRTATYEATAQVLLQRRLSELVLEEASADNTLGDVQTELEVMDSRSIEDAVTAELGHRPDVRLAQVGETSVVNVTASSDTPDRAATDADTYAATYVDTRRQQALDDLAAAIDEVQGRVDQIDAQIDALGPPPEDQADPRREALETRRAGFDERLDSLQVASNLAVTGGAQVVSEARRPSSPVEPQPLRDGAIAFGIGLLVAVALAFVFEQLNDRVRSRAELERAAGQVATIGLIPSVPGWRRHAGREVVMADVDTSSAAEAYRSLRTAVQFLGLERDAKVTQVTSSLAAEGKTTTVANLGIALAVAGKRVVVVDADLRHPGLPRLLGVGTTPGLTEVLLGGSSLEETVVGVPGVPSLAVLPAGQVPPNPPDLLVLRGFGNLVESLKASYDHVVIDTPPVLPVTDALIVAAIADIVLLVAAAGSSNQKDVGRAVELLRQIDAPVGGTILNKVPTRRYGPDYFYGYGYSPSRSRRRGWFRRAAPASAPAPGPTSHADEERAPL